jgi:hypothetical protein
MHELRVSWDHYSQASERFVVWLRFDEQIVANDRIREASCKKTDYDVIDGVYDGFNTVREL